MRSVRLITICKLTLFVICFFYISTFPVQAQENSPYSRYGLGDVLPSQNIVNRSMGGLSIPYRDYQSVNFVNPASLASLKVTTLDVGVNYSTRTLRTIDPPEKFKSAYLIPTYLQLGLRLSRKGNWGMTGGIRQLTRIGYNLGTRTRLPGVDSVFYNYEGNGGSYQAFLGTGFGNKSISFGVNVGYLFGNRQYSTKVNFINDTVPYKKTNSSDTTRFGGLFVNAGLQYTINIGKSTYLRLGLTGSLNNKLKATRDITRETYEAGVNGSIVIDSIYREAGVEGTIIYPGSYGGGFLVEKEEKWQFGAEYSTTKWNSYRYFEMPDRLRDSWTVRVGGQIIPDITDKKYWSRVMYRIGFSYGADYIDLKESFNQYLFTFGAGLPVRRSYYTNQYTTINLGFEIGARGSKSNALRENLFRVCIGLNLSDIWFTKRAYQ